MNITRVEVRERASKVFVVSEARDYSAPDVRLRAINRRRGETSFSRSRNSLRLSAAFARFSTRARALFIERGTLDGAQSVYRLPALRAQINSNLPFYPRNCDIGLPLMGCARAYTRFGDNAAGSMPDQKARLSTLIRFRAADKRSTCILQKSENLETSLPPRDRKLWIDVVSRLDFPEVFCVRRLPVLSFEWPFLNVPVSPLFLTSRFANIEVEE